MGEDVQMGSEAEGEAICPECGTRFPLPDMSAEGMSETRCPNCGAPYPPPPAGN